MTIAQSKAIAKNYVDITTAKLTCTEESGTLSYEMTSRPTEPYVHLKLNDNAASSVVLDSMGNFNGKMEFNDADENTENHDVVGKVNGAINLPGTRYYDSGIPGYVGDKYEITIDDDNLTFSYLTDFSFGLWCKSSGTEESGNSIGLMGWGAYKLSLEIESGVFRVGARNGDGSTIREVVSSVSGLDGEWHHVFCTYSAEDTTLKLYVDGNYIGSVACNNSFDTGTNNLSIGNSVYGGNLQCFNGDVDDVRIYTSTLSQSDVQNIYNSDSGTEEDIVNWETVSNGIKHTFANVGQELRYRITSDDGVISKLKVEINK